MLSVLLSLTLTADPTGVLLLSRQGLANDEVKRALSTLDAELTQAGVAAYSADETAKRLKATGAGDPSTCNGKAPCLLALAAKGKLASLLTVSVAKLGTERAWVVEVLVVDGAKGTAREDWVDETGADVTKPMASIARKTATLLTAPAVASTPDVPAQPKLVPTAAGEPPPPDVALKAEPAPPRSRVVPTVLVIGAGVAAVAAIGLGIGAGATNSELNRIVKTEGDYRLSPHTTSEAQALAGTSNALAASAIASGVVAAGLGTGAILTW